MSDPLIGTFGKPFKEAVAAFRLRLGNLVPTARWDDVWQDQHDRAFMVAGATKADLLADLAAAVDKAIARGTSLEEFRADFRRIVEERGWHGWTGEGTKAGEAWRTRVIYRTNMRTAYAAGRMAQLVERNFPLWVYRHGGSVEPRIIHLGWDGLVLPPDHPFWATHAPPNGWGCSCYVVGAYSFNIAQKLGGQPGKQLPEGWQKLDPKTGAPVGIDKGWAYAPGRAVAETVSLAAKKIASLPPEMGADFFAGLEGIIERHWPVWIADTLVGGRHDPGLVGFLSRGVTSALAERGIAPASAEVMLRPGLVVGPKADRHESAGNALSPEQWLTLPRLFRNAQAIYLDRKTGALVYVLPGEGRQPQLAVRVDYLTKVRRSEDPSLLNMVVSAFLAKVDDILGRSRGGLLELIWKSE